MASDAEINMNVNIRGASNAAGEMAKLEKMAEFTEKDQYRLEVSTKNRLELIQVIRELEQSIRDSLQAKDAASLNDYQEKLAVAKEQFEKLNQEEALTQILFAQQMQAGAQLVQNFDYLGESVGNLSKALEEGTLDLTGMGNAIMQMGMAIKSGLSSLAVITASLQVVQSLYNSYAQTKKQVAEAEKENADILSAEKTLYEELATARREYDAQVALATSLKNLNTEYEGIKTKLGESLKLIEESTRAEIVRLSLIQDEEELMRTQERYELGRAFKRGDITNEEYRRRLILLDKEKETAAATKTAAEAQANLDAATKTAEQKKQVADAAFQAWDESAVRLKQFSVDEGEIRIRQTKIEEQQKKVTELEERIKKAADEQGVPQEYIPALLGYAKANDQENLNQLMGHLMYQPGVGFKMDVMTKWLENYRDAHASTLKQQSELDSILGGRTVEQYSQEKAIAAQEEKRRAEEKDSTNAAAREAWRAVRSMPSEGEIQNNQNNAVARIEWETEQKILDLENDIAVAKADAERARKLQEASEALQGMSAQQLKAAIKEANAGAWVENQKDSETAQELSALYAGEQSRRKAETRKLSRELLGDRVFDSGEIDRVFAMFNQAVEENNRALQETVRHVLNNAASMHRLRKI